MLWIWMGDQARVDDSLIPDFHHVPPAGKGYDNIGNYLLVNANYLIEIDNLMDLCHVNFLHEGTLGNESMRSAQIEVMGEGEDRIRANLWMPDTICAFGERRGQLCNQWYNIVWMPPSSMLLEFGVVPPGMPLRQDPFHYAFHIVTPETDRTTHYFFGTSDCYGEDGAMQAEAIRDAQIRAFLDEDTPIIEAVDRKMDGAEFWSLRPALLPSDRAAVMVRRRIERMCSMEKSG
jgi:vanillate O-demethylase monooxygenase subunit